MIVGFEQRLSVVPSTLFNCASGCQREYEAPDDRSFEMNKYGFREPSWRDLLAEPIIQDVMKRDRVEAAQVIQLLDKLR